MTGALFAAGVGLVVTGLALIYVPAALIAGGAGLALAACRLEVTRDRGGE